MDVRCVLVDDSPLFVQTARISLDRQGIIVVGVASNSADALRLVAELRPDVTLIDVFLGNEWGFDLIDEMERSGLAGITLPILMSTYAEEEFADVIESSATAVGFMHKNDLSGDAIREIVRSSAPGLRRHQS